MAGGTTFHFLSATPQEALDRALEAADGKDIRVGGGPTVVRDFLKAGLVDQLHVAIAPILLGRGIRLWDDLRGLESGYRVTAEPAESGTAHLTLRRYGSRSVQTSAGQAHRLSRPSQPSRGRPR